MVHVLTCFKLDYFCSNCLNSYMLYFSSCNAEVKAHFQALIVKIIKTSFYSAIANKEGWSIFITALLDCRKYTFFF